MFGTQGVAIYVKGERAGFDARGRPVFAPPRKIEPCVIAPAGDETVEADGMVSGDISKLQVIAPAGTVVKDGDVITIHGEDYTVSQMASFDYSLGRRPVFARHRPKVVFIVERGEVSGDVA